MKLMIEIAVMTNGDAELGHNPHSAIRIRIGGKAGKYAQATH